MDWETFLENLGVWYSLFTEWYLEQPIFGQVLAIIGIIALLALSITLIYYIIKGIAYLVYYIIKGVFYLLKYIGYGFFKLCESFYLLVSGKPRSKAQKNNHFKNQNSFNEEHRVFIEYCCECGKKITNKMKNHIKANEIVFCVNCGIRLVRNQPVSSLIISH
jgi:hypothetical protein